MVENRYLSVLSSFSAEEIAEGLREMGEKYGVAQDARLHRPFRLHHGR
jgi:hypothetical protein